MKIGYFLSTFPYSPLKKIALPLRLKLDNSNNIKQLNATLTVWHAPCCFVFMKKMEKHNQIQKDFFDTMINDAIEDLRKSGLEDEEIITIISQEFGPRYVHHLFEVAKQAGARET
jgi:hypothetical protein